MLYDKKVVTILALSFCYSLQCTDECNLGNVQNKADQLKSDAAVLQDKANKLEADAAVLKTNANKLKADATTLKANAVNLKTNVTQLEADYNKLMTLSNNADLLDDAIAHLKELTTSSSKS